MNLPAFCLKPECQTTAGCVCGLGLPVGAVELQDVIPDPQVPPPMLGSFSTFLGDPQLERIANALERIANALEGGAS